MAREPGFRGSVDTWLARLETWLSRSDPADLLNVDIVFDARTVHGDARLMHDLLLRFRKAAAANPPFLKLMIASHNHAAPPLGLFGGLKGDPTAGSTSRSMFSAASWRPRAFWRSGVPVPSAAPSPGSRPPDPTGAVRRWSWPASPKPSSSPRH